MANTGTGSNGANKRARISAYKAKKANQSRASYEKASETSNPARSRFNN